MRRHLYILVLISLFACERNNESSERGQQQATYQENIDKYIPKFEGVWINKAYVQSLVKTRSPYQAQLTNAYYLIYIKSKYIKNNLIGVCDQEYGQTEACAIRYFKVLDENTLEYRYSQFDERIFDSCTDGCPKLILISKQKDTILLAKDKEGILNEMVRIEEDCVADNADCEVVELITSLILSGTYDLLDSSKQVIESDFTINKDGLIKGSSRFKRAVLWEFFREVNNPYNFDVLQFIPADSDGNNYGFYRGSDENIFKFEAKADTIQLRATKYNEEDWKVDVGDVMYYLVKH